MHDVLVTPSAPEPAVTRVTFGSRALDALTEAIAGAPRVLLVADERVAVTPFGAEVRRRLGPAVLEQRVTASEDAKTLRACEGLWDAWIAAGAGRDAVAVALGGGLVSDVAGFAAACFHRGIAWVIVPTTTLSMADAAVGGKTAVNTRFGKNLVGAVHHPAAVLADPEALASLPPPAFAEGFAEVIKAAVVGDEPLLAEIERDAPLLRVGDRDAALPLLLRALRVKADVVAADSGERSRREILNFGHTVAHAIEHVSGHAVSHGRAVAAGIVAESLLAERRGRLPPGTSRRIASCCEAIGVPWRLDAALDAAAIVDAMRRDKKSRAGAVRVALPTRLGAHDDAPGVVVDPQELAGLVGAAPSA